MNNVKVQLALRNTEYRDPPEGIMDVLKNKKSKLIAWYTGGPFSHVEIVYTSGNGESMALSSIPSLTKYESIIGVREKVHEYNDRLYTYVNIDIENFDRAYAFFKSIEGEKYDKTGILLSQLVPLGIDRTNRWFCSEFASKFMLVGGTDYKELWLTKAEMIHPNKLAKIVGVRW